MNVVFLLSLELVVFKLFGSASLFISLMVFIWDVKFIYKDLLIRFVF